MNEVIPELQVDVEWGVDPIVAGLVGASCEVTARNRGVAAFVAPLREIRRGLVAWLGFREEWVGSTAGTVRGGRLAFRSCGMTIHVGVRNSRDKPQMFRAEWQGPQRGTTDTHDATKGAGHPHWQVDALDSFVDYEEQAQVLLRRMKEEGEERVARDFSFADVSPEEHEELMAVRNNLSRFHFASAAAWWRPAPANGHAHVPTSLREIESWLRATLDYTVSELARL
ncbi:MAG: hypothetical protein OXH15_11330 [Gammaproteobacteria bacterium]|nr:hypothetical protein [Gammaproteobacteria bacterium]